jgi:hypothetical protein
MVQLADPLVDLFSTRRNGDPPREGFLYDVYLRTTRLATNFSLGY